jgi:hypothetical protein
MIRIFDHESRELREPLTTNQENLLLFDHESRELREPLTTNQENLLLFDHLQQAKLRVCVNFVLLPKRIRVIKKIRGQRLYGAIQEGGDSLHPCSIPSER